MVSARKCTRRISFTLDCTFKREGEDPSSCLLVKVGPERHYVSAGLPAKRLYSFDSVTLYGNDPHIRPDIYGKIGNAGVYLLSR
jgi:methylmalonyl-CoA mutase